MTDGFGDQHDVLVLGDAEGAVDVEVPALAEDGDDGGSGVEELADVAVLFDGVLGEAGAAECGEFGVAQREFAGAREELLVFGVAAGPAAFNVINSEVVEFLGNEEFVLHGERDGLALRAVPESCIEGLDFHGG